MRFQLGTKKLIALTDNCLALCRDWELAICDVRSTEFELELSCVNSQSAGPGSEFVERRNGKAGRSDVRLVPMPFPSDR
jgi:hypothetical protein